jgi:hypothetical protein
MSSVKYYHYLEISEVLATAYVNVLVCFGHVLSTSLKRSFSVNSVTISYELRI